MNPSREELLFQLALSKPAANRAAWLDAECEGDAALRARLAALLAAHEQPDEVLAAPAAGAAPTIKIEFTDPPDEAMGQMLGRYKLLERVGEGGCNNDTVHAMTQTERAHRFRALHERDGVLLIPNLWDAGSARILEGLGFEALATSSAAFAATLGRHDGKVTRDEALAHIRQVVEATSIPVAADLENGFGDEPAVVTETIRLAAEVGVAGGSIEDAPRDHAKPPYDLAHATERVAAAVAAARALPFPFTLTARAENFVRQNPNLDDTIQRLLAYERAGADVLFAPGLPDLAAVREVCSAVRKPVNFMVGIKGKSFSVAELAAAGVKRISFAGSLYRAAMTGLFSAAREIKAGGTFSYLEQTITSAELGPFLQG